MARLNIRTFWRAAVFVVNCLVFVLIGIRLPVIGTDYWGSRHFRWQHVAGLIGVLSLVAIGVRFLWIFTATYGVRVLMPSLRQRDPASARVSTLVSWCGMRGRRFAGRGARSAGRRCRAVSRFRNAIS